MKERGVDTSRHRKVVKSRTFRKRVAFVFVTISRRQERGGGKGGGEKRTVKIEPTRRNPCKGEKKNV